MNMRVRTGLIVAMVLASTACGARPTEAPTDSDGSPVAAPALLRPSPGLVRSESAADAPIDQLVVGFNDAGFRLLRTLPATDNLVLSPLSIGHALLMARAAADEPTGAAIDSAFGLPAGIAAHRAWNAIDRLIADSAASSDDSTLAMADRIWPRVDVAPEQSWIDLLAAEHGVTTAPLDFAGDAEGSRQIINSWVGDQTEDLIPELLPANSIQPSTTLVLTDAVYFKAAWLRPFGKYPNVTDSFTRLDGSAVQTEYMHEMELGSRRGVGDGFSGAEIPYVGQVPNIPGDFSMLVVIPDEGRFEEMRERLDQDLLAEIDATFTFGPYELLVPKWETTTHLDLLPWLTDVGVAPGSYPAITPDSFLDSAVHGADITVDEWGTVAAAATALIFEESGPPEPELTIAADRPFFYVIRHRPTGLVLFAGQVTDPTA